MGIKFYVVMKEKEVGMNQVIWDLWAIVRGLHIILHYVDCPCRKYLWRAGQEGDTCISWMPRGPVLMKECW